MTVGLPGVALVVVEPRLVIPAWTALLGLVAMVAGVILGRRTMRRGAGVHDSASPSASSGSAAVIVGAVGGAILALSLLWFALLAMST